MNANDDTLKLTSFIRARLIPAELKETFDETSPLLELGVLDSLSTAVLLGFIRRELGVTVPAEHIDPANFTDVRSVAAMLRRIAGPPG